MWQSQQGHLAWRKTRLALQALEMIQFFPSVVDGMVLDYEYCHKYGLPCIFPTNPC